MVGLVFHINTLRLQQQQATIKTNREREEVQPVFTEALLVCRDFAEITEFFFRKDLDDASRRQKCAQWGVNYIFEPNEPGAPPASNPATAPNT